MPAAEPSTQSSRVRLTISMIVRTPRPSSPTSQPTASSYSSSAEALERLPSLFLQPLQGEPVAGAVGQHPREQEAGQPAGSWASVRNRSDMGAEVNHLWP